MLQAKNEFNQILNTISEQCLYKSNIVISIDGMCASGKTTLALMLQKIFDAMVNACIAKRGRPLSNDDILKIPDIDMFKDIYMQ